MAKKIIIYGSKECGRCNDAKEALDKEGIRYGYVDVIASLAHLQKYLNVRDAHPEVFAEAVKLGKVGLPVYVIDDDQVYTGAIAEMDLDLFR
ncbi:glutaredoxin family protein [Anaerotruncus rubiinfantis]|uniref:glutaredoxin family protein n=1 Tax=Anaerotruncus rubiinfantis TaxID=1720200 RepID=UPI00082BB019|nr:glutaredoxin domain-containing protein [Anaerotruncus rubiinfantis]